jgi:hypothetical protein
MLCYENFYNKIDWNKANFQKPIFALLIVLSTLTINKLSGQDPLPFECGMHESQPEQEGGYEPRMPSCVISHFGILQNQIYSDLERYQPQGEIFKVRANFIIIQRQDGTGNFQNNAEHLQFLNDWIDRCNSTMENTWWSSDPACHPPASGAKVEIVPNWVFLPDPSGNEYYWNVNNANSPFGCPNTGSWWLNALDQIIVNDPSIPKGINVYLTKDAGIYHQMVTLQTIDDLRPTNYLKTWCSEHPSLVNKDKSSRIHAPNFFLKYFWFQNHEANVGAPFSVSRNWLVNGEGDLLAHEFGHSFIREYIHYNACPDHLMSEAGSPGFQRALRTTDVAFIHRGLMHNNLRQFIDCDTRYNASMYSSDREWNITQDEDWELDIRMYHNIRVSPGATLTIMCNVLMPEDGVIIVEKGGRLVVDGGRIGRANTCDNNRHWAGIAVKGYENQLQPNPYTTLTAADGGVVILAGDGEIQGAIVGVVAQSHPHWDVPADRGGLIIGDDFTFVNNVRGVQFMRYDLPNFSYFKNVNFINDNGQGKWGATMWRTNNIFFESCYFENLTRNGIESWDASYHINKKNQFKNCHFNGILSGGSMPLAGFIRIGHENNSGADRNIFVNNTVGFRGTANTRSRVLNNIMDNFDFDVAVTGVSNNEIYNNHLSADAAGIQFENTGFNSNEARCNEYDDNIVGINIVGNNQAMTFRQEKFDSRFHDLFLEGKQDNPGRILTFQGNSSDPVWNFFTSGKPEQIKTSTVSPWNNTVTFHYFHPDMMPPSPLIPRCALNDGNCTPASNFNNFEGVGGEGSCIINIPIIQPCETRACLDSIRIIINDLWPDPIGDPEPPQPPNPPVMGPPVIVLEEVIAQRECTMDTWLEAYILQADWAAAEELIESDLNPLNLRRRVALALNRDQFAKADSLLAVFPQVSVEDEQFVVIQTLNRNFLSQASYTLSNQEETTLRSIALSDTREAGYAMTLLSLLTGEIIMPRLPELDGVQIRAKEESDNRSKSDLEMIAYPNPAKDVINIELKNTDAIGDKSYGIEVYEAVSGKRQYKQKLDGKGVYNINVSQWHSGMYIITLMDFEEARMINAQKLIINK